MLAGPESGRVGHPPGLRGGVRASLRVQPRTLRRPLQRVGDDVVGAVGRILQRALREVSISLSHAGVAVPEDLLDFIERPAAVHQEGRILVAQVVDPQMR